MDRSRVGTASILWKLGSENLGAQIFVRLALDADASHSCHIRILPQWRWACFFYFVPTPCLILVDPLKIREGSVADVDWALMQRMPGTRAHRLLSPPRLSLGLQSRSPSRTHRTPRQRQCSPEATEDLHLRTTLATISAPLKQQIWGLYLGRRKVLWTSGGPQERGN